MLYVPNQLNIPTAMLYVPNHLNILTAMPYVPNHLKIVDVYVNYSSCQQNTTTGLFCSVEGAHNVH